MAAFSVGDRKRPGPDRRSTEISKVISEAFAYVVFTELYPRTSIDVYIEILQADAGTRCAGLTVASVALADAGIPMLDLIPSCSGGKIDGQVVVDLFKDEDNYGQADLPMAIIPRTNEILLMQMDGHLTSAELDEVLELVVKNCQKIYNIQKESLQQKYSRPLSEETRGKLEQVEENISTDREFTEEHTEEQQ
jgi:exosome complex component RRP41